MKESPDATYQFFGAVAVIRRLRALTRLIEGVCENADIEYVHKMRVASRRLRTGMTMFKECLPADRRKHWRQVVEKVTRSLGSARDLDVQIEFVTQFAQQHPNETVTPGVQHFLRHLQIRRAGMQDDIQKAVKQLRKNPMLRELRKHLRKLRRTSRSVWENEFAGEYSEDARRIARGKILRRYREFLAYEGWVSDPSACRKLHEMRIAAKRLRYAMEIFDPLWRSGLGKFAETIKGFQQELGEMHDCDVWINILPAVLEEQQQITPGETFEKFAPGLQALFTDRRIRRDELYNMFYQQYRAAQAQGFWESLLDMLNHPPSEQAGVSGDEK